VHDAWLVPELVNERRYIVRKHLLLRHRGICAGNDAGTRVRGIDGLGSVDGVGISGARCLRYPVGAGWRGRSLADRTLTLAVIEAVDRQRGPVERNEVVSIEGGVG